MQDHFMALNPVLTFGQLANYTSAMYAKLSILGKKAWVALAEADKAQYLHELASYVPAPGYDVEGNTIIAPVNNKDGEKGKPEKDADNPECNMVLNQECAVAEGLKLFEITILTNNDNIIKVFEATASSLVELDENGVLNTALRTIKV